MAYGMTYKTQEKFINSLAKRLRVKEERIKAALEDITREEVVRIARNDLTEGSA